MSSDLLDDGIHQLQASLPQGLNQDDNATLLQSIFLNDMNQTMAMRRQALANSYGVPGVPTGSGITVCHNHNYPAPIPAPAPAPQADSPGLLARLGWPAALMMGSGLAGAGSLSYFKPDIQPPIITPTSTTTTTNTTAPPLIQPLPKNPNFKIGVE